jgi:hypothetical protein
MKFSQVNECKSKIVNALNKAVNEMLDQLQANELSNAANGQNMIVDLVPGYFEAKLAFHFPAHNGTNGDKPWHIVCHPVVFLKRDAYSDEELKELQEDLKAKRPEPFPST